MYFDEFPSIFYQFDIGGKKVLKSVCDITLNVRPFKEIINNIALYDQYDISDGDTPEIIAEKLYGTPLLHWAVMLVNEKYDYLNDFPMSEDKLSEYVTNKYGEGNENDQHELYGRLHYEAGGRVVDATATGAAPVTNYDYEFALNESKRRIRVISPTYINVFAKDITEAFKSNV